MLARLAATVLILACIVSAALLSRPASLRGLVLSDDARIGATSVLAPDAPIQTGDRVILVNGHAVATRDDVDAALRRVGPSVELRIVSFAEERREDLTTASLQGDLPDTLLPTFYITSIDGRSAYGATIGDVARALAVRGTDAVTVAAVPIRQIFDGQIDVDRGVPTLPILLAIGLAILAVFLLWGGYAPIGFVLGFFAAGLGLWFVEASLVARLVGLVLMCGAGVLVVWYAIPLASAWAKGSSRARRYEGESSRPDFLAAMTSAEEALGTPLLLVVGSAQQAVELERAYERIEVREANSIMSSSLSMLALEGGVFPRLDVGEGVPAVWDDPLFDLDKSVGIASAVPIPAYGSSQDQWAFLIVRTKDAPSSPALVEPLLATAALWSENGVREAIAVQAAHGLLRLVREARNAHHVIPHQASRTRSESAGQPAANTPYVPEPPRGNANLDMVSEGIGVPRIVRRSDLEQLAPAASTRDIRSHAVGDADEAARQHARASAPLPPPRVSTLARQPAQHDSAAKHSAAMHSAAQHSDAQHSAAKNSASPPHPTSPPSAAYDGARSPAGLSATSARAPAGMSSAVQEAAATAMLRERIAALEFELQAARAWADYLDRRWEDEYPVDDPNAFNDDDWYDLEKLRRDERPSLLLGEPGGGKEFAARALHYHSERAHKLIGVMDCARIPVTAVDLELFGTGDAPGLVDALDGGALVLKSGSLLGKSFAPLVKRLLSHDIRLFFVERSTGEEEGIPRTLPPVLHETVGARFVQLQPLRERPEDIVRFARYFLHVEAMAYGQGEVRTIDEMAARLLESMDLPVNFTDLRALMRAAVLRSDDDVVDVRAILGVSSGDMPREMARLEADDERQKLVAALHQTEGNKSEAARILGLSRGALLRRLKRHGLM